MTLDRPGRGHSRINVFVSADAPRKNGSDRMKNRTIAAMAVVAIMVLSALLIPAFDTDGVRDGETEEQPKYIVGDGTAAVELNSGKEARISYNHMSFKEPTVTFSVKGTSTYSDVTLSGTPATGSVVADDKNIKVTITEDRTKVGVYTVEFTPDGEPVSGKIYIKMAVKETYNGVSISQDFYYAANFSTTSSVGKIVVGDNESTDIFYDQSTGDTIPTLTFQYDTDVSMSLATKEHVGSAWTLATGYSYYGTGLPAGISITVDGRIGGKLSSDVQTTDNGNLNIFAVKNGVTSTLTIPWKVGDKPVYDADFDLKVDGVVKTDGSAVMKKLGTDQTTLVKAEANGNGTINIYKVDASPSTVDDDATSGGKKIKAYTGTGTYVVKVTAEMTKDGRSMTVVKTFTVYVVGGIYDGNLKPVVETV